MMHTRRDRDIGRLFDRLKTLGLDKKTLVLFASDNGPHKEGGADDAGEERDVADQHSEIARQIAAVMASARTPSQHWSWPEQAA